MMMNSILSLTETAASGAAWDNVLIGAFIVLLAAICLYAAVIPQGGRGWWGLTILTGLLTIAGMAVSGEWTRILLLDLAAFGAVALVWIDPDPQAKSAARLYLSMLVAAVILIALGVYLGGEGSQQPAGISAKLAAACLIAGFSLKLALVPFYFWLPKVAGNVKPMTSVMIVYIVDIAAFSELAAMRLTIPWLFTQYGTIWLVLALLSMFIGALLALAQTNIKSLLAYSTIDDMGYLVLGVLAGSQVGLSGAILAALSHAFFKFLLFASVGVAENKLGHAVTLKDRGLAARFPVSAAVFILSAIGMIGVSPLFGFIGRWRLYLSGVQLGGAALALTMAAATALALLYYVRAIHRVWLGKPEEEVQPQDPLLARLVLIVVLVALLLVGLFPAWLTALIG
jgi:multicomponent Na+:H+ antiporter subunit D